MIVFPPARLSIKSGITRIEPQGNDIRNPGSINPSPDQLVENLIILFENGKNLPFCRTAHTVQAVVMPVLALLTAIFLVGPAVTYALPALQTAGSMPFAFLVIIHNESS